MSLTQCLKIQRFWTFSQIKLLPFNTGVAMKKVEEKGDRYET